MAKLADYANIFCFASSCLILSCETTAAGVSSHAALKAASEWNELITRRFHLRLPSQVEVEYDLSEKKKT